MFLQVRGIMKRSTRFLILAGLLILSTMAFVFMDFHWVKSNTESHINSTRTNAEPTTDYQPWNTLYIAPADDNPTSVALAKAVYHKARGSSFFSPKLLETTPKDDHYPVILVAASLDEFFWTPFHGRSTLNVAYIYSNFHASVGIDDAGEISLTDTDILPNIFGKGELEQIDRSTGLLSRMGYHQLIHNMAAKSIVEGLEKMVDLNQ